MPVPGSSQLTSGLNVQLFASTAGFVNALSSAQQKLLEFRSAATLAGAALAGMAIQGVAQATAEFRAFEDEVVRISKISNEQIGERVGEGIIEMSNKMPVARDELSKLAETFTRAGVRGADSINKMTKLAAKFGIATSVQMDQAADSLIRVQGQLDLTESEMQRVADGIDRVSNVTVSSARDIFNSMKRSAAALRLVGLGTTDIVALNAALKKVSASSSTAGTALRTLSQQMIRPNKVQRFAEAMGITVEKFKAMRDRNPLKLIKRLALAVQSGTREGEKLLEDFSRSARKIIAKLPDVIDDIERAQTEFNEQLREGGELQDEYNTFAGTTNNQLKIMQNRLKNTRKELGGELNPAMTQIQRAFIGTRIGATRLFATLSEAVGPGGAIAALGLGISAVLGALTGGIGLIAGGAAAITGFVSAAVSAQSSAEQLGSTLKDLNGDFKRVRSGAEEAASNTADAWIKTANKIEELQEKGKFKFMKESSIIRLMEEQRKLRKERISFLNGLTGDFSNVPSERRSSSLGDIIEQLTGDKNAYEGQEDLNEARKKAIQLIQTQKDLEPGFRFANKKFRKAADFYGEKLNELTELLVTHEEIFKNKFTEVTTDGLKKVAKQVDDLSFKKLKDITDQFDASSIESFLENLRSIGEEEGLTKETLTETADEIVISTAEKTRQKIKKAQKDLRILREEASTPTRGSLLAEGGSIFTPEFLKEVESRRLRKTLKKAHKRVEDIKELQKKILDNNKFNFDKLVPTQEELRRKAPRMFNKLADGAKASQIQMQQFLLKIDNAATAISRFGGTALTQFNSLIEVLGETDERAVPLGKTFEDLGDDMKRLSEIFPGGQLKGTGQKVDNFFGKLDKDNFELGLTTLKQIVKATKEEGQSAKNAAKELSEMLNKINRLGKEGAGSIDGINKSAAKMIQSMVNVSQEVDKVTSKFRKEEKISEEAFKARIEGLEEVFQQEIDLKRIRELGNAESRKQQLKNLAILKRVKKVLQDLKNTFEDAKQEGKDINGEVFEKLDRQVRTVENSTNKLQGALKRAFDESPLEQYIDRLDEIDKKQGRVLEKKIVRNLQNFRRQLGSAGATSGDISTLLGDISALKAETRATKGGLVKEMLFGKTRKVAVRDLQGTANNVRKMRNQFEQLNRVARTRGVREALGPAAARRQQEKTIEALKNVKETGKVSGEALKDMRKTADMARTINNELDFRGLRDILGSQRVRKLRGEMRKTFLEAKHGTKSMGSALAEWRARTSLTFDRFRRDASGAFMTLVEAGEESSEKLEKIYKNLAKSILKDLLDALVVKSAIEPAIDQLAGTASSFIGNQLGNAFGSGQQNLSHTEQDALVEGGSSQATFEFVNDTPGVVQAMNQRSLAGFKKGDFVAASQTMKGLTRQVAEQGARSGDAGKTVVVEQKNVFTTDVKEDVRQQMRQFAPELERMAANGVKQRARRGGNDQDVIRGK